MHNFQFRFLLFPIMGTSLFTTCLIQHRNLQGLSKHVFSNIKTFKDFQNMFSPTSIPSRIFKTWFLQHQYLQGFSKHVLSNIRTFKDFVLRGPADFTENWEGSVLFSVEPVTQHPWLVLLLLEEDHQRGLDMQWMSCDTWLYSVLQSCY